MSDLLNQAWPLKPVAFDTRNPPREIGTGGPPRTSAAVARFWIHPDRPQRGRRVFLNKRGSPKLLFNVHRYRSRRARLGGIA
jgi:hypothetical protein